MSAFALADTDCKAENTPQTDAGPHNLGRNVWMEIAQKLVAVGVVSAVSITSGFQWCFAFTMMMAATSAMVQPYAQPQARPHVLQIIFHGPWTWANNLSVKVQAQVCQNIFIGGRVWKTIWTKFIQSHAVSWWFGSTLL